MSDKRVKLVQTCGACPEQYDVYIDGHLLGYMRLRHGYFRVEYRGQQVYARNPKGDGCFDSEERDGYLNEACQALLNKHDNITPNGELLFTIVGKPEEE